MEEGEKRKRESERKYTFKSEQGPEIKTNFYIVSKSNNLYLTSTANRNGATIYLDELNLKFQTQIWYYEEEYIVLKGTDLCLSFIKNILTLEKKNEQKYQKWSIREEAIQSLLNQHVLDLDKTKNTNLIISIPCDDITQKFEIRYLTTLEEVNQNTNKRKATVFEKGSKIFEEIEDTIIKEEKKEEKTIGKPITIEIKGKKCEYFGDQVNGVPNGRGELKYFNGIVYEGEFDNGKRNGFGKIIFKDNAFVFGQWENNLPSLNWEWKISYSNGDQYFGFILTDKKKIQNEEFDVLTFLKNKSGEYHYVNEKSKFFGNYNNDKREGYGILINGKSGERYYGEWKDDMYSGHGLLIYRDGSYYEGGFYLGKKHKKGVLNLSNGDIIEGMWKSDKIQDASYTKGNMKKMNLSILNLISSNISEGIKFINQNDLNSKQGISLLKWTQFITQNKPDWEKQIQKLIPKITFTQTDPNSIKLNIERIINDKDGFIQKFLTFFISVFTGTYYAILGGRKMSEEIEHACDDIITFTKVFNDLIFNFFVSQKVKEIEEYSEYHMKCISDYIQTKVYSILFPLYENNYLEKDILTAQKIRLLSECTTQTLGVDQKFIVEEKPFDKCIKLLEKLKTTKNVSDKIEILSRVRTSIMMDMREYRITFRKNKNPNYNDNDYQEDIDWQPASDDIFPIYMYVFIHSDITNHYAQYHYIKDWKDKNIEFQPVVHIITFYEGFLNLVMDLDPNVSTESGLMIPPFVIDNSIKNAIQTLLRKSHDSNAFYWLPTILVEIGLEIGKKNNVLNEKCLILNNLTLFKQISQNYELAKSLLSLANEVGFFIELLNDSIQINFTRIYPSHVYTDMSMFVSRFLRFETQ